MLLPKAVNVGQIPGFFEGIVSVQDAGAQLAAPLLDLQDGMRVLDACAVTHARTSISWQARRRKNRTVTSGQSLKKRLSGMNYAPALWNRA